MRTRAVRRHRRTRWRNVTAGIVALVALGALALSPLLLMKAFLVVRSHEAASATAAANHVNQDVRDGDLHFVVHSVHCGAPALIDADGRTIRPSYGSFCVVDVGVHNGGVAPVALALNVQLSTGNRGAVYLADQGATLAVNGGNPAVIPGGSWDESLVYDVPAGTTLVKLDLHGSEYSRGVSVQL